MRKQAGYTLLELLLGLIIAILITTFGVRIIYHYSHEAVAQHKVADSIQRLKEASVIYYHNNLQGGLEPGVRVPMSLQAIYNQKILTPDDLYNNQSYDDKGQLVHQLYDYAVKYTPANKLITITLTTTNSHTLQAAKPDAFRTESGTYYYTWFLHPTQQLYTNQQAIRLDRFQRLLHKGDV